MLCVFLSWGWLASARRVNRNERGQHLPGDGQKAHVHVPCAALSFLPGCLGFFWEDEGVVCQEENMNFLPGELTVRAWGAACLLCAMSTLAMRRARIPSSSGMVLPDVCSQIPCQELHPGKTVAATSHGLLLPTVMRCAPHHVPLLPTPTHRTKATPCLKDIIPRGGL